MTDFVCVYDTSALPKNGDHQLRLKEYLNAVTQTDRDSDQYLFGPMGVMVERGTQLNSLVGTCGSHVAVGNVRLDDPADLANWAGVQIKDRADIALIAAAVSGRGINALSHLYGDFAVIVCDRRTNELTLARDIFGVIPLYYRRKGHITLVSPHLSTLISEETYNREYIAEFLATAGCGLADRTIFQDVLQVPPAHTVRMRGLELSSRPFWSAIEYLPESTLGERDACQQFRELFAGAVSARLTGSNDTWSQLSGGLDSSSIVSMAQTLKRRGTAAHGLAGTVSYADTLSAEGDERPFSDAVTKAFGLRNELVLDAWAWQDDGMGLPRTEIPQLLYPFYARDRRLCSAVLAGGGRVLLSGLGSDHYLSGNLFFFADGFARGRFLSTIAELTRWSVAGRRSFWRFTFEHGVYPNLPRWLRLALVKPEDGLAPWFEGSFARQCQVTRRLPAIRRLDLKMGEKYAGDVAYAVESLRGWVDRSISDNGLEARFPFLDRRLVEFALTLPPRLRTQPYARKWVMRQALEGILPDVVRTRITKSGPTQRFLWSLSRERGIVDSLVDRPRLADLKCVDPKQLRSAVDEARGGRAVNPASLLSVLSLETWLRVRSGQSLRSEKAAT